MRALLLKAWLRPLVVGLSLWLGISGGSWATMHWLSTRIQARIETAAALDNGHSTGREAVERVKGLYDRVRTVVDEGLAGVVRAVRAGAAAAGRNLGAVRRTAQRASDALGPGLQDARRDVAQALDLIRQRGRERGLWSEPLAVPPYRSCVGLIASCVFLVRALS